ncbi:DUF2752 domain-containing protein [Mucilaginibacter sp.]|uniref:DUF2752 domain-containing protein n=1 Tax=Mucilaginibacter sp. TaxID=1882438 RepID=UPI0025EB3655|nr:DUF2752 domain-containing protein [Mucilaginibacter sp.]
MIKTVFHKYFELAFWVVALIALAIANPTDQSHFSLCPLKLMGITWCPGCGLGHSISFLFHGDIKSSFHSHWLGIPALGMILYRVYALARLRMEENMRLSEP